MAIRQKIKRAGAAIANIKRRQRAAQKKRIAIAKAEEKVMAAFEAYKKERERLIKLKRTPLEKFE